MKRYLSMLLVLVFVFSFTACSNKEAEKVEEVEKPIETVEDIVIEEELLLDFETVPEGVIAKSVVFSMNHFSVATIYVYDEKIEIWHTQNKNKNSVLKETFDFDGQLLKSEIDKLESNPEFIIYEDDVLLENMSEAIIVYNDKLPDGVKVNYTGVHRHEYRDNSKQAEKISKLFKELIIDNESLGVYLFVKDLVG